MNYTPTEQNKTEFVFILRTYKNTASDMDSSYVQVFEKSVK